MGGYLSEFHRRSRNTCVRAVHRPHNTGRTCSGRCYSQDQRLWEHGNPFCPRYVDEVRTSCYTANASILDRNFLICVSFYESKDDASEGGSSSCSAIKATPHPFKAWRKGHKRDKEPSGAPDLTGEVPCVADRTRQRRPLKLTMHKRRVGNAKANDSFRANVDSPYPNGISLHGIH